MYSLEEREEEAGMEGLEIEAQEGMCGRRAFGRTEEALGVHGALGHARGSGREQDGSHGRG
jgi:hypothetical protein